MCHFILLLINYRVVPNLSQSFSVHICVKFNLETYLCRVVALFTELSLSLHVQQEHN